MYESVGVLLICIGTTLITVDSICILSTSYLMRRRAVFESIKQAHHDQGEHLYSEVQHFPL